MIKTTTLTPSLPLTTRIQQQLSWHAVRRFIFLIVGTAVAAFGYAIFQVPFNLAAGGLGGLNLIIAHYTGWSVGLLYFILNLPLLLIGFKYLGRWPFVLRTLIAAALFSLFTELCIAYLPQVTTYPLTEDLLLNTVYGGIVGGVGGGIVYRAGSTMGGTGIISRIIQQRTGLPLSQTYFYTDGGILLTMGLVFGWEITLYGLLMLFISGLASDYMLEGASSTRVVTIVTDQPQVMATALIEALGRGVSYWEITGGYTGQKRYMLMCTVYRPQVSEIKPLVARIDPHAFVTIGISQQAMGQGFSRLDSSN